MFDSTISTDQLEQRMIHRQAEISRLTAEQLADLAELDYRQVATGDGCRSLSEWVASRLDVSLDTARCLVRTMRRTQDRPDLREALESGVSFDRIQALSRIPDKIGLLEHLDVAGVEREAALRIRVDRRRTTVFGRPVPDPPTLPGPVMVETVGRIGRCFGSPPRPDSHRDRRFATHLA
jgi:hypothetical protein